MSSLLTVSQLNTYIQSRLTGDLKLKGLTVRGEISDFRLVQRSGHIYFNLKDDTDSVRCAMFSSNAARLKFMPCDGMGVLVTGNIDVFRRDGVYQIIVLDIQPMGAGALHTGLEQIKKKLAEKGVFDTSIKKKIPVIPKKIAIVTSPGAAALQDILNILSRRFPLVEAEIYPTAVQGSDAPKQICHALALADKSGADTLILARGGGSLEDIMPFNSESVAMAIYNCNTPLISAVGHETDTTLSDYAADMRAPTPSAAAELAVPDIKQSFSSLAKLRFRLDCAVGDYLDSAEKAIDGCIRILKSRSPQKKFENEEKTLFALRDKLDLLMNGTLAAYDGRLDRYAAQLAALSPFNILDRGYSITTKSGQVVYSAEQLEYGDEIEIRFRDSSRRASVL